MGLKKYENYSPSELSKGTMQRLNNACAMIQEEKITIFDECSEKWKQSLYI